MELDDGISFDAPPISLAAAAQSNLDNKEKSSLMQFCISQSKISGSWITITARLDHHHRPAAST